jgi:hypothetical protein
MTTPHPRKLDDRSCRAILVGYEPGSMAYRVYDPEADRVVIIHGVIFDESAQWSWNGDNDGGARDFIVDDLPLDGPSVITTTTFVTVQYGAAASTSPSPSPLTEQAPGSATPRTPAQNVATAPTRSSASPIFVSPPSSGVSERLDAAHDDDVPLRFRPLDHVLGPATPPGLIER